MQSSANFLSRWLMLQALLFFFVQANGQTTIPDKWLVLGPIPVAPGQKDAPDEQRQREAFDADYLDPAALQVKKGGKVKIGDHTYKWKPLKAKDQIFSLDELYESVDFASAYGWVAFYSEEDKKALLGVGSDDAVKVWLNGTLIHENWIPRGIIPDQDLVPATFKKGKNQLLIKVQDMQQGWAFSCRILPPEVYTEKLTAAAANGQVDNLNLMLSYGADIDGKNAMGLTAWQVAQIHGRKDIASLLIEKGADPGIAMPAAEAMADSLFINRIGEDEPGAAVLVARDGKVLYAKGFGYANLHNGQPVTQETIFRIGSITKQFTAAAILKLNEEGKLALDDKLTQFIPGYPRGDEVTIHHLLTHTSGIKSYTDEINFEDKEVTEPIASSEAHIESFKNKPYNFDPGTAWSYNNSGYFLLGYIIEKVSGHPYHDYLKENFFEPLGMDHTGVHYKDIALDNEALGYSFQDGKVNLAPDWEMSWAGGAGALYSTIGDLFKWNEAVFNGRVLQETSLHAAFTPVKLNNGDEAQPAYGYGWMLGEFRGWKSVSHGGGLPGFITFLVRFPEQHVTIAVLTNASPPNQLNPQQLAFDLAGMFFWEEMEAQRSFVTDSEVDYATYSDYEGRYDYQGMAVLTVTRKDDQLFARLSGQPEFEIFPEGDGKFFWKVVDAQVQFVRNSEGEVTHAAHTQGGQTFEAPRMKDETPADIDPALFKKYVGSYELNGTPVAISQEDEGLFVQVTGQPRIQLFPRSETEFFMKEVAAYLTFVSNEAGEIEKIILHQGGAKFEISKKDQAK